MYELPAFSAGMAAQDMERALFLLDQHEERYGPNNIIKEVEKKLTAAIRDIRDWQRHTALITDYDAAREIVDKEARL